jgi:nucleolar protein 56
LYSLRYSDFQRFGKAVKLLAFKPFTSAANALEQINAVSESQLTDELKNFLELSLPKVSSRAAAQRASARPA